jgi:5'-nucleotidase
MAYGPAVIGPALTTNYGEDVLRALVTNDDGISSEGLRVLALVARHLSFEVIVAAPATDTSGSSASLHATEVDGRIVLEPHPLNGLEGGACYGMPATPGFISLLAARGAFGRPPDVLLSGINLGANMGRAVIHSGTVGAALTAGAQGIRALAMSLQDGQRMPWETASHVAEQMLSRLLDLPPATVLNVNVPNVALGDLRGIRQATLAKFGVVETRIINATEGYLEVSLMDTGAQLDEGSDTALVASGYATVTPLQSIKEASIDLGL